MSRTRQDFCDFLAARFPWKAESVPQDDDSPLFAEDACLKAWAGQKDVPVPEAMIDLVQANVWPERFRQNLDVYTAKQMQLILGTHVAIAGLGGLGGHVTGLLARLGFCHFTLCDMDEFSQSNLNRQAFCTERTLGRSKAQVAAQAVSDIADYASVRTMRVCLDKDSIWEFVQGADIVFDCLDDIKTKMLLERTCAASAIAFVHGGVSYQEGLAFAARAERGLARLYGSTPPPKPPRQPVSVLAVAGTACMMVSLALELLFRKSEEKPGEGGGQLSRLYHLDCGEPELSSFELGKQEG